MSRRGFAAARLSRSARSAARSASIRACSLRTRCHVLRAVAALSAPCRRDRSVPGRERSTQLRSNQTAARSARCDDRRVIVKSHQKSDERFVGRSMPFRIRPSSLRVFASSTPYEATARTAAADRPSTCPWRRGLTLATSGRLRGRATTARRSRRKFLLRRLAGRYGFATRSIRRRRSASQRSPRQRYG